MRAAWKEDVKGPEAIIGMERKERINLYGCAYTRITKKLTRVWRV